MKKFAKITGIVLLSLIGLLLILFLLVRFVFRSQTVDALNGVLQAERTELLRNAGSYGADTAHFRFAFRQDTARAREIRTYFRVDTLVDPSASTWENALALGRFVARNIPHANQKIQPEKRNAIALWEYSRDVEPAFNCRLHAIMLHELLLATGIANRFVICLPIDPEDQDCHVVNSIWLPEYRKWAMLDCDMQAFITAPDGTPLSLSEMRSRYIADEPMVVQQLLGLDRNFSYYRAYWPKNLYWFQCWEQTGYDQESNNKGRYIALLPQGFDGFRLAESAVRTSDAERFWAAPDPVNLQ